MRTILIRVAHSKKGLRGETCYRDALPTCSVREKRAANCKYEEYEGQDIGYADIQVTAANPTQVRKTNFKAFESVIDA